MRIVNVNSEAILKEESTKSIRGRLAYETYTETLEKLRETGKCMLIRPTGFGKTFLLAHITNSYKKALYVYPLNIIKEDVHNKYRDIINRETKFVSYRKLAIEFNKSKDSLVQTLSKFDLIICDEAHMAGAELASKALKYIMSKLTDTHFLGATATPYRTDGYDVLEELFDNCEISEYTLHDAIQDGLIQKPHYIYSAYSVVDTITGLVTEAKRIVDKAKRDETLEELRALEIEMSHKINAADIVGKYIKTLYETEDYMKFIVFFSSKETLAEKNSEVESWFRVAVPEMNIRTLTITSDAEYINNIEKLLELSRCKNTVDIIFCIDMLNMGYHIDDLTGIIMLRGTISNIVYKQQLGRCLSAASTRTPIVFDLVNNIFSNFMYSTAERKQLPKKLTAKEERNSRLNDIRETDLIIDDRLASYREIVTKLTEKTRSLAIEDIINKMIYIYTERSATMKYMIEQSGLREAVLRSEFAKRGIKI